MNPVCTSITEEVIPLPLVHHRSKNIHLVDGMIVVEVNTFNGHKTNELLNWSSYRKRKFTP